MAKKSKKKSLKESSAQVKKVAKTNPKIEAEKISKNPKKVEKPQIVEQEAVTNSNQENKVNTFFKNPNNVRKLTAVGTGILIIALFSTFMFYIVPERILTSTDDFVKKEREAQTQREREEKTAQKNKQLEVEDSVLKIAQNPEWKIDLEFTNFGKISLNLKNSYAPRTVENFVRLTYRGYYDNTIIHRIVKRQDFAVIQGGDKEKRDGTGGQSAFYTDEIDLGLIPDELYVTRPEFKTEGDKNVLVTPPKFLAPELYTNFNPDNGTVNYKKGLILMAKTDQPDSASSQFFITLKDTILPADYTVFGTVEQASFGVLDKIFNEVTPQSTNPETKQLENSQDGSPNKDLILQKATIVSPKIN